MIVSFPYLCPLLGPLLPVSSSFFLGPGVASQMRCDVTVGNTPPVKLVVQLKQVAFDVQVVGYQLGKTLVKLGNKLQKIPIICI